MLAVQLNRRWYKHAEILHTNLRFASSGAGRGCVRLRKPLLSRTMDFLHGRTKTGLSQSLWDQILLLTPCTCMYVHERALQPLYARMSTIPPAVCSWRDTQQQQSPWRRPVTTSLAQSIINTWVACGETGFRAGMRINAQRLITHSNVSGATSHPLAQWPWVGVSGPVHVGARACGVGLRNPDLSHLTTVINGGSSLESQ